MCGRRGTEKNIRKSKQKLEQSLSGTKEPQWDKKAEPLVYCLDLFHWKCIALLVFLNQGLSILLQS